MSDSSKPIWIIPDTNILIDELKEFINVLRQYKDRNIIVGLPPIPIEESPKKDQSKQHTIKLNLYKIVCSHFDEQGILYGKYLEKIKSEFQNGCCPAEIVPVVKIFDASRFDHSYWVDEETEEFLSKAIQKYMEKEVFSTFKNLEHCGLESVQKNDDKKFWNAVDLCCNLLNSENENCKGHCGEAYRVLADILILSAPYYLYNYQKEDKIVMVSNDRTMCVTFNELVNELFKEEYHEKKLIKCVTMRELEEILKKVLNWI